MSAVKNYFSLVKFSHTIFAMPFAMIGFFLGIRRLNQVPHSIYQKNYNHLSDYTSVNLTGTTQGLLIRFCLVVFCMISARNAAMAFNRYLDKNFDAKNPRTAIREIPAGIISANNAIRFVIVNCVVFVICTFLINEICFYLSPVALFIILFYSYTKRFTALCHLVLGLGLSFAPIGAYLAVTGTFDMLPVLFSFSVLFWVSGFDIIYALQDVDFDKSQNLYSIPSVAGKQKGLIFSKILHVLCAAFIILAGFFATFGALYWFGVLIFIGMLVYQQSIVKAEDLRRVNLAFMTSNGIASVVFAVFVVADIFFNSL